MTKDEVVAELTGKNIIDAELFGRLDTMAYGTSVTIAGPHPTAVIDKTVAVANGAPVGEFTVTFTTDNTPAPMVAPVVAPVVITPTPAVEPVAPAPEAPALAPIGGLKPIGATS